MTQFKQIEIDIDVYKEIQKNLLDFNETENDVLRRLLKISDNTQGSLDESEIKTKHQETSNIYSPTNKKQYMNWKGVNFKNGLQLRKRYKGKIINASIKDGQFFTQGQFFDSPSAAGVHVTGTSVNGWIFWEYFDEMTKEWKLLDNLRNKYI